jgi:hypothetical protein
MPRSPYTNHALRERLKQRIISGDQGGRPGQWSARKAQLLAIRYKESGGRYRKGGLRSRQQSLKRWTKERWRTNSGKPSLQTGERYLPHKAWSRLTPAQKAATNRLKRLGMRKGRQFVPNAKAARRAGRLVRRVSRRTN